MARRTQTILQITPANPGWWAWYRDDETPEGGFYCPIAVWALVEFEYSDTSRTDRAVIGVDPTGGESAATPINQDAEYLYFPDGPPQDWTPQHPYKPEPSGT